jgi:glycosyltransferase involved in cell wall biosynthesis
MKKKVENKNVFQPASIVVTMRNASSTLLYALESIIKQTYPISEVIVVDNVSKDNSCELVLQFAKKSKIPIQLLNQKKDGGISTSFNRGGNIAKSPLIVFMASDATLPTGKELKKLTDPFRDDPLVVATYSQNTLPSFVWNKYNFWQKFYSSRQVDSTRPGFVLKFDCVRRDVFLKIKGLDEENFGDDAVGGEDADIALRLRKEGKVVHSNALSYHLHYMGSNYGISNILKSKKAYARDYGRVIRKYIYLYPLIVSVFLIKPLLSILPFIPSFHTIGLLLLIAYSLLITKRMFLTASTLTNPRIILVPFLNILFLYYEDFWIIQAILSKKK